MPASLASHGIDIRSGEIKKKGTLRALGYDPNPNCDQVFHAFPIACHRGFHGGVEAIVGDRDCRSGLVVAGGIDRVLAGERTNVRVGRSRTATGRIGAEDVGMDEPRVCSTPAHFCARPAVIWPTPGRVARRQSTRPAADLRPAAVPPNHSRWLAVSPGRRRARTRRRPQGAAGGRVDHSRAELPRPRGVRKAPRTPRSSSVTWIRSMGSPMRRREASRLAQRSLSVSRSSPGTTR
jgi:hypothetical protein